MIEEIKSKALENKVPIIKDGGLTYLLDLVKKEGFKQILELGTAVGYSSMQMAALDPNIQIDTLEKNDEMYFQAIANIKANGYDSQIKVYHTPIEEFKSDKMYDFIFVDAAKAQYGKYMEQFLPNLKANGVMLFDNMVFHGLIYDIESIESKNLRNLVKKIVNFRQLVAKDTRFDIIFEDNIGDGILVLRRKLEA